MAQFVGFTCDSCGKVVASAERTRKTTRFEGRIDGDYSQDLCPACLPDPEDLAELGLRPIRRRPKKTKQDIAPVPSNDSEPDIALPVGP